MVTHRAEAFQEGEGWLVVKTFYGLEIFVARLVNWRLPKVLSEEL